MAQNCQFHIVSEPKGDESFVLEQFCVRIVVPEHFVSEFENIDIFGPILCKIEF